MLGARTHTLPDCRPVLADPDDLTLLFSPVVDLGTATVAGYRAHPRFPGTTGPEVWFAAAAEVGVAAELQALAVARALDAVPGLPGGTVLTVVVRTSLLASGPVQEAFGRRPDLRGVVVELTGAPADGDLGGPAAAVAALRGRGAVLALDAPGTGDAAARLVAVLRPQLVALDRSLVTDSDRVASALAGVVADLAVRTGARLVVGGLETSADLAAALRRGVPLAEGWLLGRPAPGCAPLEPRVADSVRGQAARVQFTDTVAGLLRPVRQCGPDGVAVAPAVLVDEQEQPEELVLADPRTGQGYRAPVSLRVHLTAAVPETLHRALARPPAQRFDPVLVTDPAGHVLGLVRVEDLAGAATSA